MQIQQQGSRYKTELCRPWEESGRCKYGDKCQFAHGSQELREMRRHPKYKTEPCRTYHTTGYCPYGPRCHFIHEKTSTQPQRSLSASQMPSSGDVFNMPPSSGDVFNMAPSGDVFNMAPSGDVFSIAPVKGDFINKTPSNGEMYNMAASSVDFCNMATSGEIGAGGRSVSRPVPINQSNSMGTTPASSYSPPGSILKPWEAPDQVFLSSPPPSPTTRSSSAASGGRLSVFRSLSKTE